VSEVTAANLDEFRKADNIVAIAYLPSHTAAPASEFSATAEKHRDSYLFGLTTDAEAISAAGVTAPAVVVYRTFDDFATTYPYPIGSASVNDFEEWLKELSIPIFGEVHGENYAMYSASAKPLAYLFVDPSDEEHHAQIESIKKVAAEHRSKVNFVWIDAIKFGDHAKALNLQEAQWPSFVIQDMAQQLKYPFDQNIRITPERVAEHVELFHAGKLEPQLKSQPIPETQDESVFNLVNKQFDEIVFDDSKDVFVEFYATWWDVCFCTFSTSLTDSRRCGHCKRLKPIWDSLGDHFADVKDRVVMYVLLHSGEQLY
jgi:protein disulfide-isomerase A1